MQSVENVKDKTASDFDDHWEVHEEKQKQRILDRMAAIDIEIKKLQKERENLDKDLDYYRKRECKYHKGDIKSGTTGWKTWVSKTNYDDRVYRWYREKGGVGQVTLYRGKKGENKDAEYDC